MTAPIRDVLLLDGARWLLDSHEHRGAIEEALTFTPVGFSSACRCGYFFDLAFDPADDVLLLDVVTLYGGAASPRAFPAVSRGGSPVAAPAQVAPRLAHLPTPVTVDGAEGKGLVAYRGIGLRLPLSGTWFIGRAGHDGRQAQWLLERRRLLLVDGRVVANVAA